jgi:hypothetical protein
VIAPIGITERPAAMRAGEKTEEIVLRKIVVINTHVHRRAPAS